MHGQFQNVDRENTNSVNLAEKTSILQDLLKKHHSANSVQKNVFKLNKMLCFLRKKKCPFPAVCDFPTIILYISERSMCPQSRMFVNFFPIPLVLQSVFLSLTLCLSLFHFLFICCGKPGAQVVWTLFGFVPLQVSCQSLTVSMARGMALIRKHMKLTKFGKCTSFVKVPHQILSKKCWKTISTKIACWNC